MSPLATLLLAAATLAADPYAGNRSFMVEAVKVDAAYNGAAVGVDELSPRLLAALAAVPRHEFAPASEASQAYENRSIPLPGGRTLPSPYTSAILVELLRVRPGAVVLEICTGSGYQTALLAHLAGRVVSLDPDPAVAEAAAARLSRLGYGNVTVRQGDLEHGWQQEGVLFDAILVSCAVDAMPQLLLSQLRPGSTLVAPLTWGTSTPYLTLARKNDKGKVKPKPRPLLAISVDPMPVSPAAGGPALRAGSGRADGW